MNSILNKAKLEKINLKTEISIQRNVKECRDDLRLLIRLGIEKIINGLMSIRLNDSEFFRQLQKYIYCLEILDESEYIKKT